MKGIVKGKLMAQSKSKKKKGGASVKNGQAFGQGRSNQSTSGKIATTKTVKPSGPKAPSNY